MLETQLWKKVELDIATYPWGFSVFVIIIKNEEELNKADRNIALIECLTK